MKDRNIIRARHIRAFFVLKGVSCRQLAKRLGVSPTWFSLVLNGKKPSRRIKEAIAKELGVSYEELWE